MKKIVINWITGQDGVYLTEFLLKKGYEVHGIKYRSLFNTDRIDHLYQDTHVTGRRCAHNNLTNSLSLTRSIQQVRFDEINLVSKIHVELSFEEPECPANSDAIGKLRINETEESGCKLQPTTFSTNLGVFTS